MYQYGMNYTIVVVVSIFTTIGIVSFVSILTTMFSSWLSGTEELHVFVCSSCACMMRPPSKGTKPYQACYLSTGCVFRAHVQFCRFDKAVATADVQ